MFRPNRPLQATRWSGHLVFNRQVQRAPERERWVQPDRVTGRDEVGVGFVSERWRWLLWAAALAVGVPAVVGVGLAVTVLTGIGVSSAFGTPSTAVSVLLWVAGFAATCVPLWLLVRHTVRVGRWRSLLLGLGLVLLLAAVACGLGWLEQALRPANPMSGVGSTILAFVLVLFAAVALLMGALAIRFDSSGGTLGTA